MNIQITVRPTVNRGLERVTRLDGITVSYDRYGEGPPLVLVHGSFSDHATNWQEARPLLQNRFTVYSMARRGRGETTSTSNHTVADEMFDVASILDVVGEPAFLLGHSYGAVCALGAAALRPAAVRKLVLYEHPKPSTLAAPLLARLEKLAESEDWNKLVEMFMIDALQVPRIEVEMIKSTPFWNVWITDAKASLGDLRALVRHPFDVERFGALEMPVLLLIGTESPRDIYLTSVLNAILPSSSIVGLEGQAHEGMTTAPEQFVNAISKFLLGH